MCYHDFDWQLVFVEFLYDMGHPYIALKGQPKDEVSIGDWPKARLKFVFSTELLGYCPNFKGMKIIIFAMVYNMYKHNISYISGNGIASTFGQNCFKNETRMKQGNIKQWQ